VLSGGPGKGEKARVSIETARRRRERRRAGVGVVEEGAATFFSGGDTGRASPGEGAAAQSSAPGALWRVCGGGEEVGRCEGGGGVRCPFI
jgi:hypothetical protein